MGIYKRRYNRVSQIMYESVNGSVFFSDTGSEKRSLFGFLFSDDSWDSKVEDGTSKKTSTTGFKIK